MDLIKNFIASDKSIKTKFLRSKNKNEFEISCMNTESVDTVESMFTTKLQNCDIKIEQENNPKVKIVKVENDTNMTIEEIEEDINNRNFKQFNDSGKVLHMYIHKRNKINTVLMEVTPDIYKYIREKKSKVFIGHQCCRVYT